LFYREKEDMVDLLRDLVSEVGLECNSAEEEELHQELITGLRSLKTSKKFSYAEIIIVLR
jgi:hypothetical protein